MTLFLTSDEQIYGNTRTSFDNCIQQDFFSEQGRNVALKEIFFDAKFPTLINNGFPHAITLIDGREHSIDEFPAKFGKDKLFRKLFSRDELFEESPMMLDKDLIISSPMAEVESNVIIEIHPRLNFAMACGFLSDLTINSKEEVVRYINQELFPFHKIKPLKITNTGQITIKSNLNIFLSSNIINILGFSSSQKTNSIQRMNLPDFQIVKNFNDNMETDDGQWAEDALGQLEYASDMYTHYRRLIFEKPVGEIMIEYLDGIQMKNLKTRFQLELFQDGNIMIYYNAKWRLINRVLLLSFSREMKDIALSHLSASLNWVKEESGILDKRMREILDENFYASAWDGFESVKDQGFGGLVTLSSRKGHVILTPFQSEKYRILMREKMNGINDPVLKNIFANIFPNITVKKIYFNDVLSRLLGTSSVEFSQDGDDVELQEKNYFNSKRNELFKSYGKNEAPFALDFLTNWKKFENQDKAKLCTVETQSENAFLVKKQVEYFAEQSFNIYSNFPKLMFITASFIESSLFGSTQQKILNFFPISTNQLGMLHHRFDNPIVLKMIPNSVFHIKLLDENFLPLKAGLGVPTLLTLKKTSSENMFPVTIFSSDEKNKILFPENKHNCFKNKLSFPLLFSKKSEWRVSLRSIAFPKVKNIQSDACKILFREKIVEEGGREWILNFENSFVSDINNVVFLLNEKIKEIFDGVDDIRMPNFTTNENNSLIILESNDVIALIDGDMMRLLGFSFSHPKDLTDYSPNRKHVGVTSPNLSIFQPQEIMIISNIVEESYYAQSRPNILRIVPIPDQQQVTGYNYVQFEQHDDIGIKLDRIDDIEIKILTRKGELVDFIDDECDVKLQLEFKRITK